MAKTEVFLLWITIFPSLVAPLVLSTISKEAGRCVRSEDKPCSWDCSGLGELDFQADSFRGISLQCAPRNVYTLDLCGNLPCLGQTSVMSCELCYSNTEHACSNVTGPAMNLSAVIVTTSPNGGQRTGLQINFHGSTLSIALAEGAPGSVCNADTPDSGCFQMFISVQRFPIILSPLTPPPEDVGGIVGGVVAAFIIIIFIIMILVIVCIVVCVWRYRRNLL